MIHHNWTQGWESQENSVNNLRAQLLKLSVDIIKAIKGWLSQLLKLWLDEVVENINRWETWNTVTLVHGNSTLNHLVCVLLSGLDLFQVRVKSIETHLDAGTTRELLSDRAATSLNFSARVVFTSNLILVCLDEFSDHTPKKVHLVGHL